jgi:hypothetical protein
MFPLCPHYGRVLAGPHAAGSSDDLVPKCTPQRDKSGPGPRFRASCDGRAAISLDPLSGPANLMWFVYPRRETAPVWTAQQERIAACLHQFDGTKVCAIAVDETTDAAAVDKSLWDEVVELPNDPERWELPGWRWGMQRLHDQPGFTVRLHAKGARRGAAEPHLKRWWELGYQVLLDVDRVRESLQRHVVAGVFRWNRRAANLGVPWHFSGSMYAFRNDVVFSRDWQPAGKVSDSHYVEAWPALVADSELAACLAYDGVADLYHAKNWQPESHSQANSIRADSSRDRVGHSFALPAAPRVAIIIAGRNQSPYLTEAIESALAQTVPCEVVYADDGSSDESVAVAQGYLDRGLRVLPGGVHRGACEARNRGAAATRAPFLIHLDADDVLPPDFAERHLAAMSPATPFVYGPAQAFGDSSTLWPIPNWNEYDRWRGNTVNTSAMYARWAFDAAGGWRDVAGTMWDYSLALRAARFGTPRPSTAVLQYRFHRGSFSAAIGERDESVRTPYLELIRRDAARLTVGCLISGRTPKLFARWLDQLAASIRFAPLANPTRLLLMVHNASGDQIGRLWAETVRHAATFGGIEFRTLRFAVPQEDGPRRRDRVAALLANASAQMHAAATDLLWLVEDDILVPVDACRKLFAAVTAGSDPPLAVSGAYRNRHRPERVLGGWIRQRRHHEPDRFSAEIQPVDFVGTGCLMFWTDRPGTPKVWDSHIAGIAAHDWAWSDKITQAYSRAATRPGVGRLLMHGSVLCGHARSDTDILWP